MYSNSQDLLLSYHRRLRMLSEALELRLKGGRVSHSSCMCVVSHGYGRLGEGKDGGGGWYACGIKQKVGCMSEDAGPLPECELIH